MQSVRYVHCLTTTTLLMTPLFSAVLREVNTLSIDDVQCLTLSSIQRGRRACKG